MKTKLNNPKKIYYPDNFFEQLSKKTKLDILTRFGMWLASELELKEGKQINVSKIWITENTDNILKKIMYDQTKRKYGAKQARNMISWAFFASGPAVDMNNNFNTDDTYILVEEDWEVDSKQV